MRPVEGAPDFGRLERRLCELVEAAKRDGEAGALTPVLIVVPSALLRTHVQVVLAERFGALLNVSILHHGALAARAAEARGASLPKELPHRVREAILEGCLGPGSGRIAAYLEACPGALSSLAETMNELRNAGVDPAGAVKVAGLAGRGRESLALYSAYAAALGRLADGGSGSAAGPEAHGMADPAERLRLAARHAAAWIAAGRFGAVIHYGAYELIGSKLDFMRAVEDAGVEITWLVPFHPRSPAFLFARRFVSGFLGDRVTSLSCAGTDRILGDRLSLLYDEEAEPPAPLPGEVVRFFHAQGIASELREVAFRIHEALREEPSLRLSRTAVIARSLEPYVPHLARVLHGEFRLPFTTKAGPPAVEDRHVRAAMDLVRVIGSVEPRASRGPGPPGSVHAPVHVADDFERRPLLDLARSGLLKAGIEDPAEAAAAWDLFSRKFRIVRGKDGWVRDVPDEVRSFPPTPPDDASESDKARAAALRSRWAAEAARLRHLVEDLDAAAAPIRAAGGWAGWAEGIEALLRRWVSGFDEREEGNAPRGAGLVLDVLAEMAMLDAAGLAFTVARARARFEESIGGSRLSLGSLPEGGGHADRGGLRVLEAIEARGLAFDDVYLIGFNADLFPLRHREDPFLQDDDREKLRESLGAPIPIKSAGREEEHLLLAHILGSARRRLTVSWQRADESGRAKVPSLALREIARVALGAADAALPLAPGTARRIAAHPADRTRGLLEERGFMPRDLARLGSILPPASPGRVLASASWIPRPSEAPLADNLLPGLKLLDAVESFGTADLSHDAVVGDAARVRGIWSPSALETMGNCPQRFFFADVLRVEPLDDVMREHELDLGELGRLAHAVLRDVLAALIERGAISRPGADPEEAARIAVSLLEEIWPARAKKLAARIHRRYPLLWRSLADLWRNALTTFLLHDIVDLERRGARVLGVEHAVSVEIPVAGLPAPLALRGRFDRVLRDGTGRPVVADYKTAGNLEKRVDVTRMLKGHSLQIPLYIFMEEAEARAQGREAGGVEAEVIGVGPAYSEGSTAGANPEGYPARESVDTEKLAAARDGLMETIRILVETASSGVFPLNPETGWCRSCSFVRACRKDHHPTLARLEAAPATARYLALGGKSTMRPFAGPGGQDDGGAR